MAGEAAGRLIPIEHSGATYQAFVPQALAPVLAYDGVLVARLSAADRALGELAGLARGLANPEVLIRPFVRREAVLSSRIEGTQADVGDVYLHEVGGRVPASRGDFSDDVRAVVNYVHALEYGVEAVRAAPFALDLVQALHARLMDGLRPARGTPGDFRVRQNWIGRAGLGLGEAEFVPPPAEALPEALAAWAAYVQATDDTPPLVRLALIHYQFEAIHPFLDGNGRIGRLLVTLLLVQWGLLPLPLLYLSAFFERQRQAYYAHLRAVSTDGAWNAWLGFFLQGVAEQSRDALTRAGRLQDLRAAWRARLVSAHASATLLRLVDMLFEQPVLTVPQAQEQLGVTYRGAKLNVDKLVELGILVADPEQAYGKVYRAEEVLGVVG